MKKNILLTFLTILVLLNSTAIGYYIYHDQKEHQEDEENYVVSFSHDEVSQTIGEIDKDELGEYFCYCLQRDDIIAEWLDTRRQNDEFKQLEKGASPY